VSNPPGSESNGTVLIGHSDGAGRLARQGLTATRVGGQHLSSLSLGVILAIGSARSIRVLHSVYEPAVPNVAVSGCQRLVPVILLVTLIGCKSDAASGADDSSDDVHHCAVDSGDLFAGAGTLPGRSPRDAADAGDGGLGRCKLGRRLSHARSTTATS